MWEQNALLPEWHKFASVQVLDLGISLKKHPDMPPGEAVAIAIEEFVRTARSWEPDVILFYARPALLSDLAHTLFSAKAKPAVSPYQSDELFASGQPAPGRHNMIAAPIRAMATMP